MVAELIRVELVPAVCRGRGVLASRTSSSLYSPVISGQVILLLCAELRGLEVSGPILRRRHGGPGPIEGKGLCRCFVNWNLVFSCADVDECLDAGVLPLAGPNGGAL